MLSRSIAALARRAAALAGALTVLGSVVVTAAPAPAFADAGMEAAFVADMNAARAAAGLRPYAVSYDLVGIARGWSARMASAGVLSHNPALTAVVPNWQMVGENVGVGPTVGDIHAAFMASPHHRANILDAGFTQVGVGVVVAHGRVWVTEDFRRPFGAQAPAPRPAPPVVHHAPRPAPAPVHHAAPPVHSAPTTSAPTHPGTADPSVGPAATGHPAAHPHAARHAKAHHASAASVAARHRAAARLLARLHALGLREAPGAHGSDPLARAVTWQAAMGALAG